jgi:hypothetical protein
MLFNVAGEAINSSIKWTNPLGLQDRSKQDGYGCKPEMKSRSDALA